MEENKNITEDQLKNWIEYDKRVLYELSSLLNHKDVKFGDLRGLRKLVDSMKEERED